MNWWLAGGWFVACVLVGISIYRQQWRKVRDYVNWVGFCDHLHQAIGFALQPLPQAVAAYLPVCRGGCRVVLNNYLQLLQHKQDLTREGCSVLTANSTLAEFLYQLGRTRRDIEQDKIVAVRAILVAQAEQAKHDLHSKASIMLKLLIIIGIAGGILWI
ncbi:MAG: hypothetical protein J5580_02825 [Clostridia bacterium]|nr:hypothetical protein [Clostridia bacterium]